jgi:hypothetical protein
MPAPGEEYRPPEDFLTMSAAADRINVSIVTLRKLIRESGVTVYRDPRNKRVRLLKESELKRLTQPVPEHSDAKRAA